MVTWAIKSIAGLYLSRAEVGQFGLQGFWGPRSISLRFARPEYACQIIEALQLPFTVVRLTRRAKVATMTARVTWAIRYWVYYLVGCVGSAPRWTCTRSVAQRFATIKKARAEVQRWSLGPPMRVVRLTRKAVA